MNKQEIMMKAVCDLKGDLNNCDYEVLPREAYIFSFIDDSKTKYITRYNCNADDCYRLVCTIEEFDNLVDELSRAEWIPEKVETQQKRQISNLEKMQYMYDWQAGDMCIYKGIESLFIAYHPNDPCAVIEHSESGIFTAMIDELSKPLTAEQKAAKERDEAIDKMSKFLLNSNGAMCGSLAGKIAAQIYDAGLLKTEV
jgi:hypothetical protein